MATTIDQQVALDEALVPSTKRLRIGRSNFRLPSDIQSKESTLQVVYNVLRRCPFFQAFLVTADVPEIYIQEFWATAIVHHHSIRFKMNNKKHIINLETFRDMLHVCPRVPGQSFDELPFEAEILEFLRFLGHSDEIRTLTDVNVNKLFQPRRSFGAVINACLTGKNFGFDSFRLSQAQLLDDNIFSTIKVVSRHQNTQQYRAILPIELTNEDIRNTMAYKEYYACATGVSVPKPKASAKKKRGDSDTSLTPPIATPTPITTAAPVPRITAAAKGKQPAKAKSSSDLSKAARTEAELLKIVLRRSRQETHISQRGGSSIDKGTGSKPGVPDVPSDESEEEISWNSSDDEDVDVQDEGDKNDESDDGSDDGNDDDNDKTVKDGSERDEDDDDNDEEEEIAKIDEPEDTESDREDEEEETRQEEEESFNPIPRTPEDDEDDGNGVESIFTTASSPIVSLQTPTPIMTYFTIATITTSGDAPIPPTPIPSEILENLPTFDSVFRFDERLKSLETTFSEYRQTNPFVDTVSAIPGNKSIQRSGEQRNLYKALVEAYDADKTILDTFEESTILKRRREDDDQEGPSAGSDRG
nr:hypothetical protein [Tanacetum cinerariifolium]